MTTDDELFNTDDMTINDWWTWVERLSWAISDGATRVGIGLIAAGGAIAAAQMFGSPAGSQYAGLTLSVSGGFALWFVVSAAMSAVRRR